MVTPGNAVGFIIIHPQISKRVTAKIILVSPASILVGEWLQRQQHFWAYSLYVRSEWDARHCLHCLVLTDICLYNFTKGKTYRVNQTWRHTACLQHPCYDVGCYPCIIYTALNNAFCNVRKSRISITDLYEIIQHMYECQAVCDLGNINSGV